MFSSFKRLIRSVALVLAVAACTLSASEKLKVGMYSDYGAFGGGLMGWVKILINCPEVELVLVDVGDIRAGKLAEVDMLLMPGGLTGDEFKTLGPEGVEIVRKYVADGGKYLGTCAGCGLAMNIGIGLRIVNCGNFQNTDRGQAMLNVRITKEGAKLMGIKPGIRSIQYAGGPIPDFTKAVEGWDGSHVVLATYEDSLGKTLYPKKKGGKIYKHPLMYGHPAMVFATYGKGKVVISGPHPEKYESTTHIALGQIYALTGVKCTYVAPGLKRRPLRVAFNGGLMAGKDSFRALIDLYRTPELDVYPSNDFGTVGSLDHADVLVLPDGSSKRYSRRFNPKNPYIKRFQERGGIVIAFGEGAKYLPVHKNSRTVESWQELKPAILKCFE
jgi:glutamine amidotransferase-like uncharacterized protein